MPNELKPCPFCGEQLFFRYDFKQYEHPRNDCFLAKVDSEYGAIWFDPDFEEMAKAWNRRMNDVT